MAQQGGAGNSNPDIFNTIELKAAASQVIFDSTAANTTTLQDGNPAGSIVVSLPATAGTLALTTDIPTVDLQTAFDNGQSITIADTDNQTLALTNNDTTNDTDAMTITSNNEGRSLFIDHNDTGTGATLEIDRDGNNAGNFSALSIAADNAGAGDAFAITVSSGNVDFGSAGSLEIPNGAAPVVDADGEIAMDTTVADFSTGLIRFFLNEEQAVVSMPAAQFVTPTDGDVVAYNATNDEFELVTNYHL